MAASIAHLPGIPTERDHNKQQFAVGVDGSGLMPELTTIANNRLSTPSDVHHAFACAVAMLDRPRFSPLAR
jgi:hypothetical protein